MADGTFRIDTRFDTEGAQKGINSLTSSLKKLGGVVASVFAVGAIIKFGKEAIGLASDLVEVDNVVSKAFGNMRGEMDALADTAITQLGMSRLTAYQTGSTFMSMGRSMLDSADDAKVMALELTKLTGNMSSFFNVSQDLASIALKSIYTGETETLKQYGVVMTETNLKEFARAQGIKKAYSEMTQSEKVMLRYQYVMNQLSFIGDDFIDTQDSWANQTRILKEQWKEFMSVIGSTLISVLTPAIKVLNQVVSSLISATKAIQSALSSVFGIQIQQMSDATQATAGATSAMDDYGDSVEEARKKAKKNVAGFDELNTLSDTSEGGSKGGSGGGGVGGFDISGMDSAVSEIAKNGGIFAEVFGQIKDYIDSIDFNPLIESFENLGDAIMPLISLIGEGLGFVLREILMPFGKWWLENFAPAMINLYATALNVIVGIIETLKPLLSALWENIIKPIGTFLGNVIVVVIERLTQILSQLWNELLQPIVSFLVQTLIPVIQYLKEPIQQVLDTVMVVINSVFDILSGLITFLAGVFTGDMSKIMNGLKTIFSSAWTAIKSVFSTSLNVIWNLVSTIFNKIKETIKTILTSIKGTIYSIIHAIQNVWTVVFTSISNTTSSIFNGIWDSIKFVINGIIGGIEWMANAVIKGINTVIGAMNNLSFEMPDWLGGAKFGFDIPKLTEIEIPRLATGRVLPANNPFLAVVGDQKSGTNVEAPLDTIKQALIEAMGSMNGGNGDVYISADGDLNALVRLLNLKITNENNRVGKTFVKAGSI